MAYRYPRLILRLQLVVPTPLAHWGAVLPVFYVLILRPPYVVHLVPLAED